MPCWKIAVMVFAIEIVFCFTGLFSNSLAAEEEAPEKDAPEKGLMVWRLEAKNEASPKDIDSITGVITNEAQRYAGKGKVISEADIRTAIKAVETKQQCDASTDASGCMAEIGNAMGVPEAISGDLGRLGTMWVCNLRRVNVQTLEVIARTGRTVEGEVDDILIAVAGMVAELFGQPPPPQPVILIVESVPSGAVVKLNDLEIGVTPLKTFRDPGNYTLTTYKKNHYDAVVPLVLISGEKNKQTLVLKRFPMNPYTMAGHITFWSGLAIAGMGGLFTWQAHQESDLELQETRLRDFDAAKSHRDKQKVYGGLAIGSYALGGASMIAGAILFIISPGDDAWGRKHLLNVSPPAQGQGATVTFVTRF